MKLIKLQVVLRVIFFIFCFSISVKAQAACQAEICGPQSNPPSCGDGDCTPFVNPNYPNYPAENHGSCPQDCSVTATCGDGVISAWEDCNNCAADVPVCAASCGDSVCSSSIGETCLTCAADCGNCGRCGDGVCNCAPNGLETVTNCPEDCTIPTTTTTTVPAPFCGNGVCNSPGETSANCILDCPCPAGQVFEVGACRAPCVGSTPYRLANGSCAACPAGQVFEVGACRVPCTGATQYRLADGSCGRCPIGQVFEVGACRVPCAGSTPYRLADGSCGACPAATPVSSNGHCCPTGNIYETAFGINACLPACPAATPNRREDGSCNVCPYLAPVQSYGHCCSLGYVYEVGACRTPCAAPTANRRSDGTCSACTDATPYLYPTNNPTYNALGWGGQCRRCPETAPWDYNGTCNNCPQSSPYVVNGACSVCPAGQNLINGSCRTITCNMYTKVSLQYLGDAQASHGNGISYNTNASGNSCASSLVNAALAYADTIEDRGSHYYDDKVVDFLQAAALANGCSQMGGHWNRCINGTWYLDANCNPISAASLPAGCSASQITAVVTTQFYDSSPISLIMDKNLNIDNDVTITSFAVNPNEFGKWYSWKASAKAPLLVYDPAHTGLVNSATQLFGNWTFGGRKLASLLPSFQADKVQWENGYQALATLDANGDQKISAEELSPLALWFDENRDGKSQAGEVKTVSEVGITALYFNPDRRDKVTSSIYATLGYERTVDGKTVTGSSVDWYATKANNPQALIADRLLRNINQSEKTDNLSEGKKDSNSASAKQKSAISGVWAWDFNLANAKNKNPQGVLMFGSVKGDSIKGMSFSSSELQNPVNDIAHIAKVYNLEGTLSQDQNGQEKIAFSSKFASAKINSQAVLSKDGSKLEGSSTVVSKDQNGKAETITYQWTAVRYTKK